MSKLSEAIKATSTYNVVAGRDLGFNLTNIEESVTEGYAHQRYKVVRLMAKFGAEVTIMETDTDGQLNEARQSIRKAVVEEVFGEFRPIINQIRIAAYQDDRFQVARLIGELESQMFGV